MNDPLTPVYSIDTVDVLPLPGATAAVICSVPSGNIIPGNTFILFEFNLIPEGVAVDFWVKTNPPVSSAPKIEEEITESPASTIGLVSFNAADPCCDNRPAVVGAVIDVAVILTPGVSFSTFKPFNAGVGCLTSTKSLNVAVSLNVLLPLTIVVNNVSVPCAVGYSTK